MAKKRNAALQKLIKFCEKKGVITNIQRLTFGYERVVLDFTNDPDGFYDMCHWLDVKKRSLVYESKNPFCANHFIGFITVMPVKERDEWLTLSKQDEVRLDDWWRRYSAANEETRRLMAYGAIT